MRADLDPSHMDEPSGERVITVVLVDDHLLFRQSLMSLMQAWHGIEVVGESGDSKECIRLIGDLRPDVAVLDISMKGLGGIELTSRIREISPKTAVLILTMYESPDYVYRALKQGSRGYIVKADPAEQLETAIRAVARGEIYLSPRAATQFIDSMVLGKSEREDLARPFLTRREQEVCALLIQGRGTEQIAEDLFISPKTVRVHIANIMKKFSCANRTELVLKLSKIEGSDI